MKYYIYTYNTTTYTNRDKDRKFHTIGKFVFHSKNIFAFFIAFPFLYYTYFWLFSTSYSSSSSFIIFILFSFCSFILQFGFMLCVCAWAWFYRWYLCSGCSFFELCSFLDMSLNSPTPRRQHEKKKQHRKVQWSSKCLAKAKKLVNWAVNVQQFTNWKWYCIII